MAKIPTPQELRKFERYDSDYHTVFTLGEIRISYEYTHNAWSIAIDKIGCVTFCETLDICLAEMRCKLQTKIDLAQNALDKLEGVINDH